ncbi:MAG: glycosyltransferase family 9 protein [Proteobacteria bacterium]|nr:glycosyltransferase family 9 protein [Pseudomonadota bacterium]
MSGSPLVVRFGAVGDLVLLTPLLHLLHRRLGQPCDLLGSGAWMAPLLAGNPDVRAIHTLDSRRRPYLLDASQRRIVELLRARIPGPVYVCDTHALDKVRWLLARAGIAPQCCVYVADVAAGAKGGHWNDLWLHLGECTPAAFAAVACQSSPEDRWAAPRLFVADRDRDDLRQWLNARGFIGKTLLLLQPGNKRTLKRGRLGQLGDDKTWPIERWAALADALARGGSERRVLLCGAPSEAGLLEDIRRRSNVAGVAVAAMDLPLRRLMALLEVASGMISVDTGPAHMAAALGCPLVVMFGAASPQTWLPRSPFGSDVVSLGGPPLSSRVADIGLPLVLQAFDGLRLRVAAR